MTKTPITPGHTWTVRRWADPSTEEQGVPITLTPVEPTDHYFANFWLPILGPTCTFLAARLADVAGEDLPGRFTAGYLAGSLGLSEPHGRNCALSNSLHRLEQFKVLRRIGVEAADDTIEVRTHLRLLSAGQHERLPEELQDVHMAWVRLVNRRNLDRADPNCDPKSPFLRGRAAV